MIRLPGLAAVAVAIGRLIRRGPPGGDERLVALGRAGEREAARLLERSGFRVLERNVMAGRGEADLVCLDPDGRTIVIVEVKTRRIEPGERAIPPEAGVRHAKRRRLLAVTRSLIRKHGWTGRPVRIDVVAVDWPAQGGHAEAVLRHHVGAVRAAH